MLTMLSKLAIRNVKRSIKDYSIYIITVMLAFSLIFAFNFVSFSKDIVELSKTMNNFKYAIIFVSIIIVFVIAWLINYTMKFMFDKRSKEFGTYMLLGIEKKNINKMFLLENLLLGIVAFIGSFFVGLLLGNIISAVIMHLFEMPYQINLAIGIEPIAISIGYFILIYLFTLFRSSRRLKKMKIHDLLYLDKKNEQKLWKKKRVRSIFFFLFLFTGIIALYTFDYAFKISSTANMMIPFGISIILMIISIYGLTFTLGDFILTTILKNKKMKYQKDNLFVARNFSSKVKTFGMTLGTLSMLITLTLISMNVSFVLKDAFDTNIMQRAPYDFMVEGMYSNIEDSWIGNNDNRAKGKEYIDYIKNNYQLTETLQYTVYSDQKMNVSNYIKNLGVNGALHYDCYIKVSEYNKLLTMLDREELSLKDDEYFVLGSRDIKTGLENVKEHNPTILLNEKILKLKDISYNDFIPAWSIGNSYLIVVPDSSITSQKIITENFVANTDEETTEQDYIDIHRAIGSYQRKSDNSMYEYFPVTVQGDFRASNKSAITMFSFSLLYISFIFVTVVGTILSIQTLSDSTKNKYQYKILLKLGVDDHEINKTIKKQILCNFIFPIVYPIIITGITAFSINRLFGSLTSGEYTHIFMLLISIAIFLLIYGVYFLATYFTFKKNVKE